MRLLFLLIFLCVLAIAFYALRPTLRDYAGEAPTFSPETFFNGKLVSYGAVRDWRGKTIQRFTMHAEAHWEKETGTMDEHFLFADGTTRERHWTFRREGTRFIGTAPDVEGDAVGEVTGPALHWIYNIRLPLKQGERLVHFDDWLILTDENHLFSEVKISKFGLPVGRMTMFFEKQDQ